MVVWINKYLSKNYLPRWIILSFDLSVIMLSVLIAHLLLSRMQFSLLDQGMMLWQTMIIIPVYLVSFLIFRPFTEVIRRSTLEDILIIIYSITFSVFCLILISLFVSKESIFNIPFPVIVLLSGTSMLIMVVSRVFIQTLYHSFFQTKKTGKKIIIYGAGNLGQLAFNAIMKDKESRSMVIAFIDDNSSLHNKRLIGTPIYSAERAFQKLVKEIEVSELIIAISSINLKKSNRKKIIDLCIEAGVKVREVPDVSTWINGGLNVKQFKSINIEDLLGRDTIQLDRQKIIEGVKDATILVSGAAGSIGSEIVRQLVSFKAKKVILLDTAESPLYDLQNDIIAANNNPVFKVVIADITNKKKLRNIFEQYSPSIVFNAAAYKHVPLMEGHPCEAIRVNIGGTKNLVDLSVEYGVEKFVFISTDKAVNPTNVMGASKRIGEIYIQSLIQNNGITTRFITTRFGNVLGSNGSVVPLFKKQIEAGGPVTVTHREIARYFMTIPEACQLVLEAGFMGKGGEIFVFDMGEPIKIINLAEKMISLSGLVPHKDIKIKITSLRPGEKLYEELLNDKEQLQPTYNDKIMIGKFQEHSYEEINKAVSHIIDSVDDLSGHDLVALMKSIVPEYISMNSEHCCLDKMSKLLIDRKSGRLSTNVLVN